jgi:hypothetical protein
MTNRLATTQSLYLRKHSECKGLICLPTEKTEAAFLEQVNATQSRSLTQR